MFVGFPRTIRYTHITLCDILGLCDIWYPTSIYVRMYYVRLYIRTYVYICMYIHIHHTIFVQTTLQKIFIHWSFGTNIMSKGNQTVKILKFYGNRSTCEVLVNLGVPKLVNKACHGWSITPTTIAQYVVEKKSIDPNLGPT